jgi:hypothetical protein
MEPKNRYDGVPARVVRNVRFKARQLARRRAIPGMETTSSRISCRPAAAA